MSDSKKLSESIAIVKDAIAKTESDAGALFEIPVRSAIRWIFSHDAAEFYRLRNEIKQTTNVPIGELDKFVKLTETKSDARNSIFPPVELWPEPVNGAQLLDEISITIQRFIIADLQTLQAAALWAVMTWLTDHIRVCPIANITAPEKRCGKTELLSVLGKLSYRSLQTAGVSTAALFRCIDMHGPTLLIDEVDIFLAESNEARGILNAGFTRDSALTIRCAGDEHSLATFNVWGAKALCGIGKVADTLSDRSIPLQLRRKKPGEEVERQGRADPKLWEMLRSKTARFAKDNAEEIKSSRPDTIEGLHDRANDCWEPLLAIAEVAGGDWPIKAKKAALALQGSEEESPTIAVELLQDIKTVFENRNVEKIFSADLLKALIEDEEAPWATYSRGKPLTARQLANRLKAFGIHSKQQRIGTTAGRKGYSISDFEDAWLRYFCPVPAKKSSTPLQPKDSAGCSDIKKSTQVSDVDHEKTLQPKVGAACSSVDHGITLKGNNKWKAEE